MKHFHISWPNLAKCWCCSFHKKTGIISMKTVAVSVAQYHIMGNRTRKHSFPICFNMAMSNKFSLEIKTLHCKLKPLVNRLSLICPMPDINFLCSFFLHFSFFPIFSWFLQNFSLAPGTYLLKLCSPSKKMETSASQGNLYTEFSLKGCGLMLVPLIFVTSNLCCKTTLKMDYIYCTWKILISHY